MDVKASSKTGSARPEVYALRHVGGICPSPVCGLHLRAPFRKLQQPCAKPVPDAALAQRTRMLAGYSTGAAARRLPNLDTSDSLRAPGWLCTAKALV